MLQYSKHQRPFRFLKFKTGNELSNKYGQWKISDKHQLSRGKYYENVLYTTLTQKKKKKKKCYLCLNEKFEIAPYRENRTILKMQTPKQIEAIQVWHKGLTPVVL